MRAVVTLTVVALVVPAGGWSFTGSTPASATLPPPPNCSAADTRRTVMLISGKGSYHAPLYMRACGPAHGVIDFNGRSYSIQGGWCTSSRVEGVVRVRIGLATNQPAAPGQAIWLKLPLHPGRITITDSVFELPVLGDVAGVGTVILNPGLKSGTFTLHSRGAANGPSGHFTGSWSCGD